MRTLTETDYLLGVADATRLGALRFRRVGDDTFQAPVRTGVPAVIELGRLLQITERILRNEETDEDPKETDEYSVETWEKIAFRLAERAGIATPHHELVEVAGKAVLLSRRFDRIGETRVPSSKKSRTQHQRGVKLPEGSVLAPLNSTVWPVPSSTTILQRRWPFDPPLHPLPVWRPAPR